MAFSSDSTTGTFDMKYFIVSSRTNVRLESSLVACDALTDQSEAVHS